MNARSNKKNEKKCETRIDTSDVLMYNAPRSRDTIAITQTPNPTQNPMKNLENTPVENAPVAPVANVRIPTFTSTWTQFAHDAHRDPGARWLAQVMRGCRAHASWDDCPITFTRHNDPRLKKSGLVETLTFGMHTLVTGAGKGIIDDTILAWRDARVALCNLVQNPRPDATNGDANVPVEETRIPDTETRVPCVASVETCNDASPNTDASTDDEDDEDDDDDPVLVCEGCGRNVRISEGVYKIGGKRLCESCAHPIHARVNAPNPDASDAQ